VALVALLFIIIVMIAINSISANNSAVMNNSHSSKNSNLIINNAQISSSSSYSSTTKTLKRSVNIMNIGDYVQFGRYLNEPILWEVVNKSNGIMLISKYILCLKAYDASEDGDCDQSAGSLEWSNSNLREWLNSNEKQVKYSTYPPKSSAIQGHWDGYENESGFLTNFTLSEYDQIMPTKHNNVSDYVFIPSENEIKYLKNIYKSLTPIAIKKINDNKDYPDYEGGSFFKGLLNKSKYWAYYLRSYLYYNNLTYIESVEPDKTSLPKGEKFGGSAPAWVCGTVPVLNLKSNAVISSGKGIENAPYIINGE
jgi:hypothetical protein